MIYPIDFGYKFDPEKAVVYAASSVVPVDIIPGTCGEFPLYLPHYSGGTGVVG